MLFTEQKVAQMAAYFLMRRGGRMSYLKLMKLLYLSDRESLNRYGEPISCDRMVSMAHGPVLSQTYDLLSGQSDRSDWDDWIQGEANYEVSLKEKGKLNRDALDELSQADIEVMESVWAQFGSMTRWEIRDWTHNHCPEWEDPHGSSFPIDPRAVFRALGRSESEADEKTRYLIERKQLCEIMAELR